MLCSSQFEWGTCPCLAMVADPTGPDIKIASCHPCVVTYSGLQALAQAHPGMMQHSTSNNTCWLNSVGFMRGDLNSCNQSTQCESRAY